jgi:ornithine cyclodeaminase/alanine dehydrogenase-like protein (mu-crystallin family)
LIWSRTRERALSLAHELGAETDIVVQSIDDLARGVREADIIVTATTSTAPLVGARDVNPGAHISAMGADRSGKQELDVALMAGARLFADLPLQSVEIGEFQHVVRSGVRAIGDIVAIGDVLAGRQRGRVSDRDITIFDSSGVAIQDLNVAKAVLDALNARGHCSSVAFG